MAVTRPEVVFFGSGPVAAASLELLAKHCIVEAVITKPQPPHHKDPFPVLVIAEKLGLKTFTPGGKKELSELFAGKPVGSKLGVVIDYGFIIGQDVIDYFPLGIINSHFSLLPEWRGADPITFAILSGQDTTGISLMLITAGLDEGPILAYAPYKIPEGITTPELTDALIHLSDETLRSTLPGYVSGTAHARPQTEAALLGHDQPSYSRKLTKADGMLDLTKPAEQLEREIRAYIGWPGSRIILAEKEIIVTKAHVLAENTHKNGTIWLDYPLKPRQFGLQTSNGILVIDRLKPAGKPEMSAAAFLAGYASLLE